MLLSHCSSEPLLGDFFGNSGFLSGGSQSDFVLSKESLVELLVYQATTWLAIQRYVNWWLFCIFLLLCFGRSFLGYFLSMAEFFGGVARHELTEGCSSYNLSIWTWSVMILVGLLQAPKSTSLTCFLLQSGAWQRDFGNDGLLWRRISTGLYWRC